MNAFSASISHALTLYHFRVNKTILRMKVLHFSWYFVFRKEDGTLRTMNAEKLLKTLPVLQAQLDSLLEFDCTANDLTNGVISMAFMLLFRDLIRLFACYNDGIINLLGEKKNSIYNSKTSIIRTSIIGTTMSFIQTFNQNFVNIEV